MTPNRYSVRDFFRNPEKRSFQISPDGLHVSFESAVNSRMNVFVRTLDSDQSTQLTFLGDRDVSNHVWVNATTIVFSRDFDGDENTTLFAVNVVSGNSKHLTPFKGVKCEILDRLLDDDEHILVLMNKEDDKLFDVYKVNVESGETTMVAKNPGGVTNWKTDHDGNVRLAIKTDGVRTQILVREETSSDFRLLLETSFKDQIVPLLFTFDNRNLYALSNIGRDKQAGIILDLESGKEIETVIENDEVDVVGLGFSRERKVLSLAYWQKWRLSYQFFDEVTREQYAKWHARFPMSEVGVASRSKDETKFILFVYSDKSMGEYFFTDTSTGEISLLSETAPWIDSADMAEMKCVEYTARDGRTITAYLTLPIGKEARDIPLIMHPHGGPWHRDGWYFNPYVQFLANRGYAVLQPNFRGSVGFGKDFWMASFKQWGRAMQDDLTDGVQWLIAEGIADAKRVAIMGGSYGGYATLAGVTFTPELYCCGFDIVGVANLFTFMESFPPYWIPMREMMYEMVGHPELDKELMVERSPSFHADKITKPLYIVQGANDPRVKQAESDQMVAALRARGVDVPYMLKENEGHGFHNEENRIEMFEEMEKFFAKYLG